MPRSGKTLVVKLQELYENSWKKDYEEIVQDLENAATDGKQKVMISFGDKKNHDRLNQERVKEALKKENILVYKGKRISHDATGTNISGHPRDIFVVTWDKDYDPKQSYPAYKFRVY